MAAAAISVRKIVLFITQLPINNAQLNSPPKPPTANSQKNLVYLDPVPIRMNLRGCLITILRLDNPQSNIHLW